MFHAIQLSRALLLAGVLAFFSACGGGSGSGDDVGDTAAPPVTSQSFHFTSFSARVAGGAETESRQGRWTVFSDGRVERRELRRTLIVEERDLEGQADLLPGEAGLRIQERDGGRTWRVLNDLDQEVVLLASETTPPSMGVLVRTHEADAAPILAPRHGAARLAGVPHLASYVFAEDRIPEGMRVHSPPFFNSGGNVQNVDLPVTLEPVAVTPDGRMTQGDDVVYEGGLARRGFFHAMAPGLQDAPGLVPPVLHVGVARQAGTTLATLSGTYAWVLLSADDLEASVSGGTLVANGTGSLAGSSLFQVAESGAGPGSPILAQYNVTDDGDMAIGFGAAVIPGSVAGDGSAFVLGGPAFEGITLLWVGVRVPDVP